MSSSAVADWTVPLLPLPAFFNRLLLRRRGEGSLGSCAFSSRKVGEPKLPKLQRRVHKKRPETAKVSATGSCWESRDAPRPMEPGDICYARGWSNGVSMLWDLYGKRWQEILAKKQTHFKYGPAPLCSETPHSRAIVCQWSFHWCCVSFFFHCLGRGETGLNAELACRGKQLCCPELLEQIMTLWDGSGFRLKIFGLVQIHRSLPHMREKTISSRSLRGVEPFRILPSGRVNGS